MEEINKYKKKVVISSIILILLSSLLIYIGVTCIRFILGLLIQLITNRTSSLTPSTDLHYIILVFVLFNTCLAWFIVNIIIYIKYIKQQKLCIKSYKNEGVK